MGIMAKFIYAGDINNWMDLRDEFIEVLQNCDNESKLNKFIHAIFISVCPTPESINVLRKEVGIKKLSKKEIKHLSKMYEDKNKNDRIYNRSRIK